MTEGWRIGSNAGAALSGAAVSLWALWGQARRSGRMARQWREHQVNAWIGRAATVLFCMWIYRSMGPSAWRWPAVALYVALYGQLEWYIWRQAGESRTGRWTARVLGAFVCALLIAGLAPGWRWVIGATFALLYLEEERYIGRHAHLPGGPRRK